MLKALLSFLFSFVLPQTGEHISWLIYLIGAVLIILAILLIIIRLRRNKDEDEAEDTTSETTTLNDTDKKQ